MQDMQVKNHWTQDSVKINHDNEPLMFKRLKFYCILWVQKKNPLDEAVLFSILIKFFLCNVKLHEV